MAEEGAELCGPARLGGAESREEIKVMGPGIQVEAGLTSHWFHEWVCFLL